MLTTLTWLVGLAGGIAAQVYRYRHVASASQRQQTKWIMFGFVGALTVLLVLLPLTVLAPSLQQDPITLLWLQLILTVSLTLVPLSIGVAILRHRLFRHRPPAQSCAGLWRSDGRDCHRVRAGGWLARRALSSRRQSRAGAGRDRCGGRPVPAAARPTAARREPPAVRPARRAVRRPLAFGTAPRNVNCARGSAADHRRTPFARRSSCRTRQSPCRATAHRCPSR